MFICAKMESQTVIRYDSPLHKDDICNDMVIDNFNNIYLIGYSDTLISNPPYYTYKHRPLILKYDEKGILLWYRIERNIEGQFVKIVLDSNNHIYVAGHGIIGNQYSIILFKYNADGNFIDSSVYYRQNLYGYSLMGLVYHSSRIIMATKDYSTGNTEQYTTLSYDTSLNFRWQTIFTNYNASNVLPVILTKSPNSTFVYTLFTSYNSGAAKDIYAQKHKIENGQLIWTKYMNYGADEIALNAVTDNNDNLYIAGTKSGGNQSGWMCLSLKIDSSGNIPWVVRFNSQDSLNSEFTSITLDQLGNVLLTGFLQVNNGFFIVTNKYSNNGSFLWSKTYADNIYNAYGTTSYIISDNANQIYTASFIHNPKDIVLLKYSTTGQLTDALTYNGPGNSNDIPSDLFVDNLFNIYLAGNSIGNSTGYDCLVIKYTQNIGINQINSEIPDKFVLSQNYPNPFNPTTKIKFAISGTSMAQTILSVYNTLGKEVAILVNQKLQPGTYETDWDASAFPSGVYYYKLNVKSSQRDVFTETKKMVLIK